MDFDKTFYCENCFNGFKYKAPIPVIRLQKLGNLFHLRYLRSLGILPFRVVSIESDFALKASAAFQESGRHRYLKPGLPGRGFFGPESPAQGAPEF